MSPTSHIYVLYHQALDSWNRLIGFEPPDPDVLLIPDITRYFFSEAIDDRVRFLADGAAGQEESFRSEVIREYRIRIEQAIRQELKAQSSRWERFSALEKNLSNIKLPTYLNQDLFATRAAVIEFMRRRMVFFPGRLEAYEALVLAGIFLRAVQQVALEIIRVDYPASGQGTEVPQSVQAVVREILRHVEELQRLLRTPVELKSPARAETELRVLVARTKGVACLPLRSIPTAPLSSKDLEKHYVGRPDEQASRLARQIRHADGTILVTGYRGVGKSSFVNRIIFHALSAQKEVPDDGWLIVPVIVNLAKVAGVQNILRITLRSVRDALLNADSRTARSIPGLDSIPLPLSKEDEIEPLVEAYIRATYKVTMSRSAGSERRSDVGTSISIDPSKWLGGKIVGMELGKFLEAGLKKTKTEKINRELSLLDFDENAAEESLARLIRSLATPRPLGPDGPHVRIKLIFVFDELDKMDVDTGLKPMIEGLKHLFLQQYSVFMLVTSKRFYYDLLKDRAIEDAMLNSYFSAIVHVPLLSYAQAREMVNDWIDWNATEQLRTPKPCELNLIDQLTRLLVYRSFGNPRDIIRELRLMQEWADTTDQPYLTDRLSKSPNVQIFAAIQDCIEKTAVPPQASSSSTTDSDASVALASERLAGDEARLEQVRRGLYILTEELINRQTIPLSYLTGLEAHVETGDLSVLQTVQRHNFSLLSVDDVLQLTKRLGGFLSLIHDNPDLFITPDWGPRAPLFEFNETGTELRVNNNFYALTGRQITATTEPIAVSSQTKTTEELIAEAESFAVQESWATKLKAINITKQLGPEKLTPALKEFLWKVVIHDLDSTHRFAAAERLPLKIESLDDVKQADALIKIEKDERVLSILLRMLSGASSDEARKTATTAIVALLHRGAELRRFSDAAAVEALTVLQTVASHDVSAEVLAWLNVAGETELVQRTAISVLKKVSEQFGVDITDRILSDDQILDLFTTGLILRRRIGASNHPNNVLQPYLFELLSRNPFAHISKLLRARWTTHVNPVLIYLWDLSFSSHSQEAAVHVFRHILDRELNGFERRRLEVTLRDTSEFQARILPYLRRQLSELVETNDFTADQAEIIEKTLSTLEREAAQAATTAKDAFDYPITRSHDNTASSRVSSYEINTSQSFGFFIFGIVLFLPGFFLYEPDLPEEASVGTALKSRILLLVLDGLLVYAFIRAFRWLRSGAPVTQSPSAFATLIIPLMGAIIYLHTMYVGPLHFWSQAVQFLVNWPAVVALLVAFRLLQTNVR